MSGTQQEGAGNRPSPEETATERVKVLEDVAKALLRCPTTATGNPAIEGTGNTDVLLTWVHKKIFEESERLVGQQVQTRFAPESIDGLFTAALAPGPGKKEKGADGHGS